ncbi:MAG: hypothetical protein ACREQJ_16455 [Candidatus Binatia bacterium]
MKESNTGAVKAAVRRLPDPTAVREEAAEVDRRIRKMAREQPLLVLAMALAGGYLVGRLISRL